MDRRFLFLGFLALVTVGTDDAEALRAKKKRGGRRTNRRASRAVGGGGSDRYFSSCKEARAAGAAPLREGRPGYSTRLDRDGDGVACE